jgi:HK97 gp10 family phage protein
MITAKVHGQAALSARLMSMQAQLPRAITDALKKAGEPIRDYARDAAPVESGALARSITIRAMRSSVPGRASIRIGPAWAVYESDRVEYGRFIEFGTSKMPAHPFLRPAFDAGANEALRVFKAEMRRRLT